MAALFQECYENPFDPPASSLPLPVSPLEATTRAAKRRAIQNSKCHALELQRESFSLDVFDASSIESFDLATLNELRDDLIDALDSF